MFQLKPLDLAVKRALSAATVATVVLSVPEPVQSQDIIEEVVVTGSRIPIEANLTTSSPVTTIKAEEFQLRGITRVEDLLDELPSIMPENTIHDANGATGTATIDLRGLGSNRALVLVNGHRMGFGDASALAPDINTIPAVMIERVEVLTGGASSTYGSDAMAGVINFIMRKDFEGIQVNYQYGAYQHDQGNTAMQAAVADAGYQQAPDSVWDGDVHNLDLVMGMNSTTGNGNITMYLGYRSTDAVTQSERDFSACALSLPPDAFCEGSPVIPAGLFSPFNGSYYYTVAGNEFIPWDFQFYNYSPTNHFQRPDNRVTAGIFGHYQVNEHLDGYMEFQFMEDRTDAQIAPSGTFFIINTLHCGNPLLSAQQYTAVGCTSPADVLPVYIGRRSVEGGPRSNDIRHTAYSMLVGLRGRINDNWHYDAYAKFSRTILSEQYNNDLSVTRMNRALDVVDVSGIPTCQSVVDGSDPACVPWNIFQTGDVTPEAVDYITAQSQSQGRAEEEQYVAFVSGDLATYGLISPAAEEGIQVVFGGEYRSEKITYLPDPKAQTGDIAGFIGTRPRVNGGNHVGEVFFETRVPLVQNHPWAESLNFDIGYRYSGYSRDVATDTYKINTEWEPLHGLKLRGGYARAVRAPNIRELLEPRGYDLWFGPDPCAGAVPEQTLDQCRNSGVTAAQYGSIPLNPLERYSAISGGNTELKPEKANTFTVGAVVIPGDLLPGLTVSVDYWRIEVADAIGVVDPLFTVTQCGLTGNPIFCDLVNRGANGNLWLGTSYVDARNINIGFFETAGIDLNSIYIFDAGRYGAVDFTFRGTWLEKFQQQFAPGAVIEECSGYFGGNCGGPRPIWQHNLSAVWHAPWEFSLAGTWRYIGGVDEYQQERFSAGSENYLDLTVEYSPTFIGIGETTLSMGVSNVTDNDPPVSPLLGGGNTNAGMWDALGRYFFFSVRQRF